MTFEEFRATRERLPAEQAENIVGTDIHSEFAHVYNNSYYLEEWSDCTYSVTIGRCDFISKNIDELEAKIFLFMCEDTGDYENEILIRAKYGILEQNWYY